MTENKRQKDRESWIDEQIRQAQDRGDFDNLPGKGKPLNLTPNPYAPDQELAFKILKDAGYAPEWIELDKAIRGKQERARSKLQRRWQGKKARLGELDGRTDAWAVTERERVAAGWERAVVTFEEEIVAINKEIAELNLKVPSSQLQRARIDATREIARLESQSE